MKNLVAYAIAGTVLLAGAAWSAGALGLTPQNTADEREKAMKTMTGHIKVAADAATPAADAKARLGEAIKIAESIPAMFPKGTGIGDPGVTGTRALQDIWKKPAEFKAAADALVVALKSADAALGGERAKIDAAFGEVRKSCGGCHTPFRGPETE
jgi:cytochrome c556